MSVNSSLICSKATANAVFKSASEERVLLAYTNYNLDVTKVSSPN